MPAVKTNNQELNSRENSNDQYTKQKTALAAGLDLNIEILNLELFFGI